MSSIQSISGVKRSLDAVEPDPYALAKRRGLLACKTKTRLLAEKKEEMERRHEMEIRELNSKISLNDQDSMETRFALCETIVCITKKHTTKREMWFEIVDFVNFEGDSIKLELAKTTLKNTCFFVDNLYKEDAQWRKEVEEKLCEWIETGPPEKDCVLTMEQFLAKYGPQ